jgi:hypothetical protein
MSLPIPSIGLLFPGRGKSTLGDTYVEVSELAAVFGNLLSNLDDAFQNLDEARAFWFREGGKRSVSTVVG